MTSAVIEQIIERADSLPRPPAAIAQLIEVINNPSSSFSQIVDVIRFDQEITSRILRLCNSAYFGASSHVSSLDAAVKLLGTSKLLQFVMAAHSGPLLTPPQAGYGLPRGALWEHGVAVALASQRLGKQLEFPRPGTLFTAGLLHDMGKLLLNEQVGREYARIAARCRAEGISFIEAEQQVLGTTHAEVGARVAQRWRLPEEIIRVIRHHHEPSACQPADQAVDIVHVADAGCLLMGIGGGDDGPLYRIDSGALARCGLGQGDIERVGAEVVAELKGIRDILTGETCPQAS